ncbi:MAG: flippase-like domain-containing protein [bacterium]|nr:flippase-like domain-containing protein [bacterium]
MQKSQEENLKEEETSLDGDLNKVNPDHEVFFDEKNNEDASNDQTIGEKTEEIILETDVPNAVIDSEIVSIRLEEAKKAEEPKKKKKSIIINLLFLALNIAFLVFVLKGLLKETSNVSLGEVIAEQGTKLYWLLGALACFIINYFVNALCLSVMVKNTTGKFRFWLCFKCAILGKYYDDITPMAVGGQPSQILNLVKGGVTPGVATSIPIIRMIIGQLVRWFLIILLFIFAVPLIPSESGLMDLLITILKILSIVGIVITTIVSVGFLFLGSSKLVGRSIARWVISIGYRLKIVKNYRKSYDKFMRQVLEYQNSMKYLAKNKGVLVSEILLSVLEFTLFCSMGFFVCMAFSTTITTSSFAVLLSLWFVALARYQVVDMASTIMILPGGTGIKEIAFLIMFNAFLQGTSNVAFPFLAWRIFDYYLFLAVGFVFILVRTIVTIVKNHKKKKV